MLTFEMKSARDRARHAERNSPQLTFQTSETAGQAPAPVQLSAGERKPG
jgi:hypothetical protein